MSDQELDFDDSDMGDLDPGFRIPPPRPIDGLRDLVERFESRPQYPKKEMRRLWTNNMSERDKALKQLKLCDQKLAYWIAKRRYAVSILEQINGRLQEIEPYIVSDPLTLTPTNTMPANGLLSFQRVVSTSVL